MNNQNIPIAIGLITLVGQAGLILASGGFSAGKQLTVIESEIRLLRSEVAAANQVQDFRLTAIEQKNNIEKKTP